MKKYLLILLLILSNTAFASIVTIPTVYQNGGQVTAANLNGNNTAITQVLNGGIDNTNANTTQGYRLYQTVSSLPSAGSQGAVYFLTTDNSLDFDNGSSYSKSVTVINPTAGSVLYYDGSAWQPLVKGNAGDILSMNSADTAPQWLSFKGVIVMWSGTIATIPSGWALCDGTNGTPDLRNKFIVAANADSGGVAKSTITGSAAQSGGSTTITQGNLPSYNLSFTRYDGNGSGLTGVQGTTNGASATSQTVSSGGSGTAYVQPFYALAYIQKL